MRLVYGLEVDVWFFGCMLYIFLVGKFLFDTEVVKSILNRVIYVDFDLLSYLLEDVKNLI